MGVEDFKVGDIVVAKVDIYLTDVKVLTGDECVVKEVYEGFLLVSSAKILARFNRAILVNSRKFTLKTKSSPLKTFKYPKRLTNKKPRSN